MGHTIMHTFVYKAPIAKVYAALTIQAHFRQWWTQDSLVGSTIGERARFDFKGDNSYCVMEIIRLKPEQFVGWKCVVSTMMGKQDWVGTTISFTLRALNENETALAFRHDRWNMMNACYRESVDGWKYYLGDSLKSYLETGVGKPYTP